MAKTHVPRIRNSYFVQIKEIKLGRKRTATAVLELRGSTKHNAYRYRDRANEPIVKTKLPDAPRRLSKDVRAEWAEMRSRGGLWLTIADCFLVEIAAFYMESLGSSASARKKGPR
jgi:hypothetical protein